MLSGEGSSPTTVAYLALGSNLGDRMAMLRGARRALDKPPGLLVTGASSIYETEPVGGPQGQGPYLNAVLQVETQLTPRDLLTRCLAVEQRFGRRREEIWGPRTLDVDVLLFDGIIHREPDLELPHPRLHLRPFVLIPLRELAPELIHPVLARTVRNLAARHSTNGVHRLSETW